MKIQPHKEIALMKSEKRSCGARQHYDRSSIWNSVVFVCGLMPDLAY